MNGHTALCRRPVRSYETDQPVLAVEQFSGEVDRYRMRIEVVS